MKLALLVRLMVAHASTLAMSMILLRHFLAKARRVILSCSCPLFVRKGRRIVTDPGPQAFSISSRLRTMALCTAKS